MAFDVEAIRADFPGLSDTVLFNAPGGTIAPVAVANAMRRTMLSAIAWEAPVGSAVVLASDLIRDFRHACADLLGCDAAGVVQGRSATQLVMEAARTLSKRWQPGDNVVLSLLDHDANASPWRIVAERDGIEIRWATFDPHTGELPTAQYADLVDERTRLVAVTAASNLIGTRPDVPAIAAIAHDVGAVVAVDGVHLTAHAPVDVRALGADLYFASPYKLLGPHCGVLAGEPELLSALLPDKLLPSPDSAPERFELGTLPYELLAGTTAMVDYLASLSTGATRRARILATMSALEAHEDALRAALEEGLANLPIELFSRARHRTPTLLFQVPGLTPRTVVAGLLRHGIVAQSGDFYAQRACDVLGFDHEGAVRIGLAPYNTAADIDRLLHALDDVIARSRPRRLDADLLHTP